LYSSKLTVEFLSHIAFMFFHKLQSEIFSEQEQYSSKIESLVIKVNSPALNIPGLVPMIISKRVDPECSFPTIYI